MTPLSAAELLDAWEKGRAEPPAGRALGLLAAASPGTAPADWARLTVGRRDARLLELRRQTFGPTLDAAVDCPGCGERLEFEADCAALAGGCEPEAPDRLAVSVGDREVAFRLPDTLDVLAALRQEHAGDARQELLERCVLSPEPPDARAREPLPPEVVEAVLRGIEEADPAADLRFALTCPACGLSWEAPLDPASFLWTELDDWARRTLREVHALAWAYGWSESEVLSLGAWRRRAYLDLVGP